MVKNNFTILLLLICFKGLSVTDQKLIDSLAFQIINTKNIPDKAWLFNSLCETMEYKTGYTSGESYIQLGNELVKKVKDKKQKCLLLNNIAKIHESLGEYERAFNKYNEAVKLAQKKKLLSNLAISLLNRGSLYLFKSNKSNALNDLKSSMNFALQQNDSLALSKIYLEYGQYYYNKENKDSALYYYSEALNINECINDSIGMANAYCRLCNIYQLNGEFEKIIKLSLNVVQIYKRYGHFVKLDIPYTKIAISFMAQGYYEKAYEYMLIANENAKKTNSKYALLLNYQALGLFYQRQAKLNKSIQYFEESLKLANIYGTKNQQAKIYEFLGYSYRGQVNIDKALEYSFKALKLGEQIESKNIIARTCLLIGQLYDALNEFNTALDYYKVSLKFFEEMNRVYELVYTYRYIGQLYNRTGEIDKEIEYLNKSLKISEEINDNMSIAICLSELSKIYYKKENYTKSLEYATESYKISNDMNYIDIKAISSVCLGKLYHYYKDYKKAEFFLQQAIKIGNETGFNYSACDASKYLSKLYSEQNDFANAYKYHVLYKEISDSIANEAQTKKITSLELKYQFDKERKEELLKQQKKELKYQAKIDKQNITKKIILGVSVLGFITIFLAFRNYRIRKKSKEQLLTLKQEEADKKREFSESMLQLFTNISHDIRTPLNLITGPLNKLFSIDHDRPASMEQLKVMQRNTSNMLRLVDQILDYQKISDGAIQLQTSRNDLIGFISHLILPFREQAYNQGLSLELVSSLNELVLYFDSDKLGKIIVNLLSNSLKFTPSKGKISIIVNKTDKYAQIKVTDTGIGIPSDQIAKIFDRYFQTSISSKLRKGGSGIGLALTKELVEIHKGKISVISDEGKGSEFCVELPLGKNHLLPEQIIEFKDDTNNMHLQTSDFIKSIEKENEVREEINIESLPNILIVEDNYDMRKFIVNILISEYKIIEADDGQQAFESAVVSSPDIILSDIMMPNMDGIELCTKLKTDIRTCHIPVVLLTARSAREHKLEGLETGADDYIVKPFDEQILQKKIKNLIELRKKLKDIYSKSIVLEPNKITINSVDETFLIKTLKLIEENIQSDHLNPEFLANEMNMSRSVFYRKIKALTGDSCIQFIQNIRLKRAAQLVTQNTLTIAEISDEVGFADPKYFSKCFKKYFGQNPSGYSLSEN